MDSDCQCQRAGPKNFYAPNTPLYGEICSQTETVAAVVDIFVGDANTGTISEIAQGVIGFETPDSVVAAATGTANYSGGGEILYLAANAWEISETQANFAVDFNTSTISGAISVDDPLVPSQATAPNTYTFATISVPHNSIDRQWVFGATNCDG